MARYFERKTMAELKTTIRPKRAWSDIEKDAETHLRLLNLPEPKRDRDRILEIGCGIGRLLKPLCDLGWDVLGIDSSASMFRRFHEYTGFTGCVRCSGTGAIPLDDASFDCVFSIITFQHIPNTNIITTYLKEAHRVLNGDGELHFQLLSKAARTGPLWTVHDHSRVMQTLGDCGFRVTIRNGSVWRFYDCYL